jgi:voltage-dependent potassium channel beta subunit
MNYRRLGSSGLQVSELSLGSWVTFHGQVDVDAAQEMMEAAFAAGINFFDNAEAYAGGESERVMGSVIARSTKWQRDDLVVSTKIFWGGKGPNKTGLSRKHVIEGTRAALARLGLDYVDLLYCHRPDLHTPIEETVRAMSFLVNQGYAHYWGTSEWSALQISEAYHIARREHLVPPTMEQPQYHMFHRDRVEAEYAPLYEAIGLGTTTWSPLASGLLTGKYLKGVPEGSRLSLPSMGWLREAVLDSEEGRSRLAKVRLLKPVADRLGCSLSQLAIAWCLKNPNVSTVILGASRIEQLRENLKAAGVVRKLNARVIEELEGILANKPGTPQDWRA